MTPNESSTTTRRTMPRCASAAALVLAVLFAPGAPVFADEAPANEEDVAPPSARTDVAGSEAETQAAQASTDPDAAAASESPAGDDFPTTAIADYVLGCMAANGNSYQSLQQCSCSIDFIKARMNYKSYEEAATILQVQQDIGQRGIFYRDSNWAKSRVERLEALQAESTLRCF